jgi:polysaccharide export outer membrane protein
MTRTTTRFTFALLLQALFVLAVQAATADSKDTSPASRTESTPPPAVVLPPLQPGVDAAVSLPPIAGPEHPVGAEDLLEISVFEIPELNRIVRVSEKGTISLPLLGEMEVKGLTAMQLEDHLREALSQKYVQNPQVSVFVREFGSKKVSVIGAVGKPGVYQMLGPRTLLQVLSEAGGLEKEVGSHLFVIRNIAGGATDAIPVKISDLLMNRDSELNLAINPGDVISVPMDRPVYVYVDGAVKTPGRLEEVASRPISLLQAIAKAGGVTERANLKAIQILRRGIDGTQADLRVSLKKIRQGKDPDPMLEEGDVVVVPETFF